MLFYVKVRIDTKKVMQLLEAMESGELNSSHVKTTYCLKEDPAVGINICEATDLEDLKRRLLPHQVFYKEIVEIVPLILPEESLQMLMG